MNFNRIAIVNRGEPAMRLINAVEDLKRELGVELTTIALYTDRDRRSMFVRQADEAYELGPALYTDSDGVRRVGYLDYQRLEAALVETRADAAWAGWGFVAEHAEFADLCARLGVTFIGPDGDTIRKLGDKITSKLLAEEAGVPVAPWSGGRVETIAEAHAAASQIGYPLMIKATAGGGGRGIRPVGNPDELAQAFTGARKEAASSFGDATVFLERLVPNARHIEVQIIGDRHGTVWPVGVRDCTVQRRNQKIIEEAPSPALSEDQHQRLLTAAADLGIVAGYENAGTVEFLFDTTTGQFWFMEVNARLQVEHPITELTTGIDLVKQQLLVADGQPLDREPPRTVGHAIEIRLNAEDPSEGFAPAPGTLDLVRFPSGPGIRVDTGVEEGDEVAPEFDSMIAKIMAFGENRAEAIARLRRALSQTYVVVRNGATNKAFVERLLQDDAFIDGTIDVGWVDRLSSQEAPASKVAPVAVIAAAIAAYDEELLVSLSAFRSSARRGRPEVDDDLGRTVGLGYRGNACPVRVAAIAPRRYRVMVGDITVTATIDDTGLAMQRISVAGGSYRLLSLVHANTHFVEVGGIPHRITHDEGGVIRSPSPAIVASVDVSVGDVVEQGDVLAVIEAMKMETKITAPLPGRIREVLVRENVQIPQGSAIVIIDPEGETTGSVPSALDFSAFGDPPDETHVGCVHHLDDMRHMFLGYDIDPADVVARLAGPWRMCPQPVDEVAVAALENEVLEIFADILSLFRTDPSVGETTDSARRSTKEYLFAYLRNPERQRSLPKGFRKQLKAALRHYGGIPLKATSEVEAAAYRIMKSMRRMSDQTPVILDILDRRLRFPVSDDDAEFRGSLERLGRITVQRFPAVHDLAREVKYVTFDLPFLESVKRHAYADADGHIEKLVSNPDGADRDVHVRALVECPQSLTSFLLTRFSDLHQDANNALLEVMMRRYYRLRELECVRRDVVLGRGVVDAQYDLEDRRIHCIAVHATSDQIDSGARVIAMRADTVPAEHEVVADLFVWRSSGGGSADQIRDDVLAVANRELGKQQLRRLVVVVSSHESGTGMSGVLHFTFRADGDGGYAEETLYRDLHPMMAKRLQLWRLENFETERLVTLEDIYLFHGVAKDNPEDERLFALAEIRDVSAIRDRDGGVVLPDLERMFHDVLGSIRRYQAHQPAGRRLAWNRVLLHVWPLLEMGRAELRELVGRLAPDAEGIGLDLLEVVVRVGSAGSKHEIPLVIEFSDPTGHGVVVRMRRPHIDPIEPLTPHQQNLARLRRRGLTHPSDIVDLLTQLLDQRIPALSGSFVEHDLVEGDLVPVAREWDENAANIVVGIVTNTTQKHPNGMSRVAILSDPSRGMGNLAEAECSRILAALNLAERLGIPVEWFAVSAGALISMDSGTENMDWIARVLRRIIEFTQDGGEVNVIVTNINVGAQPYWNAEATMLMHTKGILIMTPNGAMVLTGKQALDYSGGVSADDNLGIGGYGQIMGPNGEAQYFASDIADACRILLTHYDHTYVLPGERFPRRAQTSDPVDRNIEEAPHGGEFGTVGEVFSEEMNPGRKKPFEIRQVMASVVDRDHAPLERWYGMQNAEVAVVWDAHIGGYPVCLIGMESKPIPRQGFIPADGPDQWTSGTLFPVASKKVARSINASSGNRPLVVLANLSGFDGSPESLRNVQLEYGAEIGRAIVNFDGPIVFVVISRYHGGAFVVFSGALSDNMVVAALEGAKASVIGGAPAAAVVFARDVARLVDEDPHIVSLRRELSEAEPEEKAGLRSNLDRERDAVHSRKLGEVADAFDAIHTVERARDVGSIDAIVPPSQLRPYVVDAIERGIAIELDRIAGSK